MITRNNELTNELQIVMNTKPFDKEKAMTLIDAGADAHIRNYRNYTILHLLAHYNSDGRNDNDIEKLVKIYGVDINANNDAEFNVSFKPLDCLLTKNNQMPIWLRKSAMGMVRLGAYPDAMDYCNDEAEPLLHLLMIFNKTGENDDLIEELINKYGGDVNIKNSYHQTALEYVLNRKLFNLKSLMKLVALGINPNPLLKYLIENNRSRQYDQLIEKLVKEYHADINFKDKHEKSLLQIFLDSSCPYFTCSFGMNLVRLGADPEVKNKNRKTILELLIANNKDDQHKVMIAELKDIIKFRQASKSNFLSLLFLLSCDINNPDSESLFRSLPLEVLFIIISLLEPQKIGKTAEECVDLAKTLFLKSAEIKQSLTQPGGINVKQHREKKDNQYVFTLFKPVQTTTNESNENVNEPPNYLPTTI